MNIQSFGTIKVLILGFPLGSFREKWHLDVIPTKKHKVYYRGGEWCIFPKVVSHVKLVFEVVLIKFVTPFLFNLH
jgi:hypothetical protein